jgi:cytochrome c553
MKKITTVIMSLFCMAFMVTLNANAAEKKAKGEKVSLSGKGICAKCNLSDAPKCAEVLQVTDADGKTKNYYVKGKAAKATKIRRKNVAITGTVKEQDGKLVLTASEIEVKE